METRLLRSLVGVIHYRFSRVSLITSIILFTLKIVKMDCKFNGVKNHFAHVKKS